MLLKSSQKEADLIEKDIEKLESSHESSEVIALNYLTLEFISSEKTTGSITLYYSQITVRQSIFGA